MIFIIMSFILFISLFLSIYSFTSIPILSSIYLDCYTDIPSLFARDLSKYVLFSEYMTIELCFNYCYERGSVYYSLQYGSECYCEDSTYRPKYNKSENCNMKCIGKKDEICGGLNSNSVYQINNPTTNSITSDISLVMIVKNEAHTLLNTLLSLRGIIKNYYILDTGSTDGTQLLIKKIFPDIEGIVFEEPFIDYGTSRNRILELATLQGANYCLMLSADETVYDAQHLIKFSNEHNNLLGTSEEAYAIVMDMGWKFDSTRFIKTRYSWRYIGKVHEYLAPPANHVAYAYNRVPFTVIKFRATDNDRRNDREYHYRDILEKSVREDPKDTRSSFYLARTYNMIGNHTASLEEFKRRVTLGGWNEEIYESLYGIAFQKQKLNYPWSEVMEDYLSSYSYSNRAEPLFAIANHYYDLNNFHLALLFSQRAASIPYPKSAILWVQAEVYNWKAAYVLALSAIALKEYDIARSALKIIEKSPGDLSIYINAIRDRLGVHGLETTSTDLPENALLNTLSNSRVIDNNTSTEAATSILYFGLFILFCFMITFIFIYLSIRKKRYDAKLI